MVDGNGQPGVALYNLESDLAETVNLAGDESERVVMMLEALEAWQVDVTLDAKLQPSPLFSPTAPTEIP